MNALRQAIEAALHDAVAVLITCDNDTDIAALKFVESAGRRMARAAREAQRIAREGD